jgi:tRNA (guanine37-N1)-methyltransferase
MNIDIVTVFPDQVSCFTDHGIFRIASEAGNTITVHDLRKWTDDKHKTVDDRPFGGGPGMVMKVEPFYEAVSELAGDKTKVILTSPRGKKLTTPIAKKISQNEHIILLCGHYEGVDERVRQHLCDMDISIGEYVLSGGELPALVIADSVLRQVPGVLGNPESLDEESFDESFVEEYPQYTRPEEFRGWKVPDILLSGDHEKVRKWREENANR